MNYWFRNADWRKLMIDCVNLVCKKAFIKLHLFFDKGCLLFAVIIEIFD